MRGRGCDGGGLSYLFEGVNEVKTMWLGSLVTKNKEACWCTRRSSNCVWWQRTRKRADARAGHQTSFGDKEQGSVLMHA